MIFPPRTYQQLEKDRENITKPYGEINEHSRNGFVLNVTQSLSRGIISQEEALILIRGI